MDDAKPVEGYIDVWWIKHDGGLLLLLSHLLKKHRLWRKCFLRLHLVTESGTNPALVKDRMHKLLAMINISASVEEVILVDSNSLLPYMRESGTRQRCASAASAMGSIFFGARPHARPHLQEPGVHAAERHSHCRRPH